MSTYKNIAVIGAGGIGGPIVKELIANGVSEPLVITRPGSTSSTSLPAGVKVVSVDYTDITGLVATFKEHQTDVVISPVGHPALKDQTQLADAAKEAGVKLFLPSEFGYSTLGLSKLDGELGIKARFADHLEAIGLPSLRIFNGGFITYIPWITGADSGKFEIAGKGDQKASFTWPADIAGFTAYVVTHLPPAELSNKIFRIQGDFASFLDIAALYGSRVKVEHVDGFADDGFRTFLHEHINSGQGSTAWDAGTKKFSTGTEAAGASNSLWSGHRWTTIKEGLGL